MAGKTILLMIRLATLIGAFPDTQAGPQARTPVTMNAKLLSAILCAGAVSLGTALADDTNTSTPPNKTLGQKTADTLEKAKDATVDAGKAVVRGTENAATAVKDAVLPDADARKVDVKLTDDHIQMPRDLRAGKIAFVVRNDGKESHNLKIEGQGIEKDFLLPVGPEDSKTLNVDLKPGNYKVFVPGKDSTYKGSDVTITVK